MLTRTTTRLLDDLMDPARDTVWSGFDARYRPVLIGFARSLGFAHDDAAELAQHALGEFAQAIRAGRYQRDQGRLSSWLFGIARNSASQMRRRARLRPAGRDSALADSPAPLPDDAQLTRIWARERRAAILAQALDILRASPRIEPHTMLAFELFAIRAVPARQVADECGIEVEAVYVIKNRLTRRLREIVGELTAAYDQEE